MHHNNPQPAEHSPGSSALVNARSSADAGAGCCMLPLMNGQAAMTNSIHEVARDLLSKCR